MIPSVGFFFHAHWIGHVGNCNYRKVLIYQNKLEILKRTITYIGKVHLGSRLFAQV